MWTESGGIRKWYRVRRDSNFDGLLWSWGRCSRIVSQHTPRVLGTDRAIDDNLFSHDAEKKKNMLLGKAGVTEKGGVVKCQQLGELSESYSMPEFSFSLFFFSLCFPSQPGWHRVDSDGLELALILCFVPEHSSALHLCTVAHGLQNSLNIKWLQNASFLKTLLRPKVILQNFNSIISYIQKWPNHSPPWKKKTHKCWHLGPLAASFWSSEFALTLKPLGQLAQT